MEKELRPEKILLKAPCLLFFERYKELMEYGYGHAENETLIVTNHKFPPEWKVSQCEKTLRYDEFYDKKIEYDDFSDEKIIEPINFDY